MKKIEIIEGVVAEYDGKFWGTQYADAQCTSMGFGDFDKAEISDPKYCTKPTDKTWDPKNTLGYNPYYKELEKARLIKVRRIITTEFDIIT
jgi:hypothetical protein